MSSSKVAHPLPEPALLARREAFFALSPLLDRARTAGLVRADLAPADVSLLLQMVAAAGGGADADAPRALELALDSMRPGR